MANPKYKNIGTIEDRTREECAELIKEICKSERFGYGSSNPGTPDQKNWMSVLSEIKDVERVCKELKKTIARNWNI